MVVLGLWTPYFYVATYGISHGMSARLANYLFALINAGSLVGRIAGGFLAGWAGQFNVITMSCYISAILIFIWLGVTSTVIPLNMWFHYISRYTQQSFSLYRQETIPLRSQ
jgi:hypothetical protein